MVWLLTQDEFFLFKHPFRCYIAGPTYSGKTKLIEKILLYREEIIDTRFDRIVLCYKAMQPTYEIFSYMDIDIELHEGLIKTSEFDPKMKNLVIIDDLMEECKDSKEILNLFTVDSHHKGISVFSVSQNIYTKGKCSREINLNSSNMIIFRNPRDLQQISILARQMFPNKSKAFMEAFNDATQDDGHSYIFLDFSLKTNDKLRIQTSIIPNKKKPRIIYTFKN